MKTKILITGGHLTPALATIEQFNLQKVDISFVGRDFVDNQHSISQEKAHISQSGIDFYSFNPPKFHRKPLQKNFFELPKILPTIKAASSIISQVQPDVVLSFGGYLALPISLAARIKSIPLVTHEQTLTTGMANLFIKQLADITALSWPEVATNTPYAHQLGPKTFLTGNPVRQDFFHHQSKPAWLPRSIKLPIIYFTGGNQGALFLNQFVAKHLKTLTQKYIVIHQYGKSPVPLSSQSKNYYANSWFDTQDTAWIFQNAQAVISRSGANTISELLVCQTPSILIPLPYSSRQEQLKNAQLMQSLEISKLLPQSRLQQLLIEIEDLVTHPKTTSNPAQIELKKLHKQAASKLAQLTLSCAKDADSKQPEVKPNF